MPSPPPGRRAKSLPEDSVDDTASREGALEEPDVSFLDSIYRTEATGLKAYFSRRLRREDEPADYVNEAFSRLAGFMSREAVREPRHYLRTIARNLLFERTRRLKVRALFPHVPLSPEHEPAVPPDQMHRLELNEMLAAYRRALGELPDKTREVFLLHRVDELPYREIGERLGISIPTVQYHMARALAHIDAALGEE